MLLYTLVVILCVSVPELLLFFPISFLFLLPAVLDGAFTIGLVLLYQYLIRDKIISKPGKWTGCLRKLVSFSNSNRTELTVLGVTVAVVDRWVGRWRQASSWLDPRHQKPDAVVQKPKYSRDTDVATETKRSSRNLRYRSRESKITKSRQRTPPKNCRERTNQRRFILYPALSPPNVSS